MTDGITTLDTFKIGEVVSWRRQKERVTVKIVRFTPKRAVIHVETSGWNHSTEYFVDPLRLQRF